jgi:hypothetical protein
VPGVIGKGSKEVNRVAKELIAENAEIQRGIGKVLDKEAPNSFPQMNRIAARINDEVIAPQMATALEKDVRRIAADAQDRVLNAYKATDGNVWQKLVETRDQFRNMLGKEAVPAGVKNAVLDILDSEMRFAMEGAAKTLGKQGLAEQFGAAVTAQRTAEHLAEMTASKVASDAVNVKPLWSPQDLAIAFGSASFGHPIFAAGMLAAKGATKMAETRIAPKLAEAAYNMSVGSKAASATMNIKGRINGAVKSFFSAAKTTAAYGNTKAYDRAIKTRDDYEKHVDRAHELVSPQHQLRVQEYARQLEAAGHLELAQETLLMNMRAVQYLQNNMPPSLKAKGAGKLGPMPKYHGVDLKGYKFMRQLSAIEQPMDVIERVASGDISRDEVKAIKYVYPELHAEMVVETTNAIMEMKAAGEFLPADKIATLGVVLDAPVDTTLTTEFIAGVQASFVAAQPPQPSPPPDQSVMVSGANFQTATQKVMS